MCKIVAADVFEMYSFDALLSMPDALSSENAHSM